jgi:hypothetical protein
MTSVYHGDRTMLPGRKVLGETRVMDSGQSPRAPCKGGHLCAGVPREGPGRSKVLSAWTGSTVGLGGHLSPGPPGLTASLDLQPRVQLLQPWC